MESPQRQFARTTISCEWLHHCASQAGGRVVRSPAPQTSRLRRSSRFTWQWLYCQMASRPLTRRGAASMDGFLALRPDPHGLAGRVRIVGNDSSWDKSTSDSWYARLQSQSLEPGMFTLQGVHRNEQQETWDRWLRFIRLREHPTR